MKKLKEIKKHLKLNKEWVKYKKKYQHKQIKFIFSKVALILKKDLELEHLIKIETLFLEAKEEEKEKMFSKIVSYYEKIKLEKADWNSFGVFIWYVYQTSKYWYFKERKNENAYNKKNYIELNRRRRRMWNNWIISLNPLIESYNLKIERILRRVY